ncbi:MAG: hypothetical protein ACYS9X_16055 [Planctomycetota bacterium]
MRAAITAVVVVGALCASAGAAETAEWREAVDLLRASRTDRSKLVPAVRKLALLAERLPEDDPRSEQVNSMLYWAKKLMTVQEAEELARVSGRPTSTPRARTTRSSRRSGITKSRTGSRGRPRASPRWTGPWSSCARRRPTSPRAGPRMSCGRS